MKCGVPIAMFERVANVRGDGECIVGLQPFVLADHLLHIRALDEFHHEIKLAFVGLPEIVNVHDARMAHLRHRLCFLFEAFREIRAAAVFETRGKNFDRDEPVERNLHRLVHRAHPARAEHLDELILRQHPLQCVECRRNPAARAA